MLFQIRDTQVFVIGSIHRQPQGANLPEYFSAATVAAEDCFFEHDPDTQPRPDQVCYPKWKPLWLHIPVTLFLKTANLCRILGIKEPFWRYKPWWLSLQLSGAINNSAGNTGRNSIDRQLWELAGQMGKPRLTLDSDVFGFLESAPLAEQISGLNYVVSDPSLIVSESKRLHAAWCKGDIQTFDKAMEVWLRASPISTAKMFFGRNLQWLPSILRAVEENRRAVFVVGVGHVVAGEQSLKRLLKAEPHCRDLIQIHP